MARLPRFLLLLYHIKGQKNVPSNVGWYEPDFSPLQEKEKIVDMCRELMIDINHKVHMTDGIRARMEHDTTFLFHVGTTLGAIREQYKSQLEIYRQMRDKYTSRNRINTPEYRQGSVCVHFMIAMEEMYAKEVQIENHIMALLKVPEYQFEEQGPNAPNAALNIGPGHGKIQGKPESAYDGSAPERPYQKSTPGPAVKPPPGMYFAKPRDLDIGRSGHNAEEVEKAMTEEELKRNMRAQYYQRHKN